MGEIEKATPRPWALAHRYGVIPWVVEGGTENLEQPRCICSPRESDFYQQDEANAALIVRAVNNHDALVAALRGLVDRCKWLGYYDCPFCSTPTSETGHHDDTCPVRAAEAALASVEGETT